MLEATVDVDASVYAPDSVSESLNGLELVPLGRLCVIHLKSNILADLVSSTTDNHHERAEEQRRVLIARRRSFTRFVRGLDPVPSTITMATKPPCIAEGGLLCGSSAEANHHTGSTASLAKRSTVIYPRRWLVLSAIEFVPRERCPLYAQTPNIIDWLLPSVATEHEKMWL